MDFKIVKADLTERAIGSAWVTMATERSGVVAIGALNGASLNGTMISVQPARIQAAPGPARPGGAP
jgi:hypothetical protein